MAEKGKVFEVMERIHDLSGGFQFGPQVPLADAKRAISLCDSLRSFGAQVSRRVSYDFCVYGPGEPLPQTDGRAVEYKGNELVFAFQWRKGWKVAERVVYLYRGPDIVSPHERVRRTLTTTKLAPASFTEYNNWKYDRCYVSPDGAVVVTFDSKGIEVFYKKAKLVGFLHGSGGNLEQMILNALGTA